MPPRTFRHHYLKASATTVACGALLLAVGYVPTLRIAGAGGVTGMLFGVSACVAAGLIGAVPVCRALAYAPEKIPNAVMLSMLLRFLITMALVLCLTFSGWVERTPFICWVAISYLVLLVVETSTSLASVKALRRVAE